MPEHQNDAARQSTEVHGPLQRQLTVEQGWQLQQLPPEAITRIDGELQPHHAAKAQQGLQPVLQVLTGFHLPVDQQQPAGHVQLLSGRQQTQTHVISLITAVNCDAGDLRR